MVLEAVVESIDEINAIYGHKIDRFELVSALDVGGVTPCISLVKKSVEDFSNI